MTDKLSCAWAILIIPVQHITTGLKKKLNILNWKLDAETLYCDNVGSKS